MEVEGCWDRCNPLRQPRSRSRTAPRAQAYLRPHSQCQLGYSSNWNGCTLSLPTRGWLTARCKCLKLLGTGWAMRCYRNERHNCSGHYDAEAQRVASGDGCWWGGNWSDNLEKNEDRRRQCVHKRCNRRCSPIVRDAIAQTLHTAVVDELLKALQHVQPIRRCRQRRRCKMCWDRPQSVRRSVIIVRGAPMSGAL
eukprot:7379180-Prymnesium_polylepis.2